MTGATIRRAVAISFLALGLALVAAPAFAQSGQIRGKVTDAQDQPVDGAVILIENLDKGAKPITTKSNKKGEYIQVGLYPGQYKITAQKGDLKVTKEAHIGLDMVMFDIKLVAGTGAAGAPVSKEEAAKAKARAEAMTKAFADGVALSNEGKNDEAIAKFMEVATAIPNCAECYANIGTVQTKAKKYDEAEAAFKKSLELKPDFAEAYNGLANLYNAQKKFDQAAEAGKKALELSGGGAAGAAGGAAGGGASASAIFNQGVILWNAGKIPEAKAQFEQATKLDPNLADAQYWLGMALLNGGDMAGAKPKFEAYLKLAPTGQYADQAKSIVASIK